jgi:hypothetical protein
MLSGLTFFVLFVVEPVWTHRYRSGLRRQFVRLGSIMLGLSVASDFVWLMLLTSRLIPLCSSLPTPSVDHYLRGLF